MAVTRQSFTHVIVAACAYCSITDTQELGAGVCETAAAETWLPLLFPGVNVADKLAIAVAFAAFMNVSVSNRDNKRRIESPSSHCYC